MVRTLSVPVPLLRVMPVTLQVEPLTVASTQVVPSKESWIFSPLPRVPLKVPLAVWLAVLVMKSVLLLPVSTLSAVTVAVAAGAVVSRV